MKQNQMPPCVKCGGKSFRRDYWDAKMYMWRLHKPGISPDDVFIVHVCMSCSHEAATILKSELAKPKGVIKLKEQP